MAAIEFRDLRAGDVIPMMTDALRDYTVRSVHVEGFDTPELSYKAMLYQSDDSTRTLELTGSGTKRLELKQRLFVADEAQFQRFCKVVSLDQVFKELRDDDAEEARPSPDHFALGSWLFLHPEAVQRSNDPERVEHFGIHFRPYGTWSPWRTGRSWDADPWLTQLRAEATDADLLWDELLGNPEKAKQQLKILNRGDGALLRVGLDAAQMLLSPNKAQPLSTDVSNRLRDIALRYGPYGKFRDLLPRTSQA